MLGVYEDFPQMFHGIARFSHTISTDGLQAVIVQSFYQLNLSRNTVSLLEFARHNVSAQLELGVADGLIFDYLDKETLKTCQKALGQQVGPSLDFLCIVRYYAAQGGKKTPLKFDYYMLRFLFEEKEVELRVYHEKGPRRLATEDLVKLLTDTINLELAKKKLGMLQLGYFYAV